MITDTVVSWVNTALEGNEGRTGLATALGGGA